MANDPNPLAAAASNGTEECGRDAAAARRSACAGGGEGGKGCCAAVCAPVSSIRARLSGLAQLGTEELEAVTAAAAAEGAFMLALSHRRRLDE